MFFFLFHVFFALHLYLCPFSCIVFRFYIWNCPENRVLKQKKSNNNALKNEKKSLRTAQLLSEILSKMENEWVIANISMHTFPFFHSCYWRLPFRAIFGQIFAQLWIMHRQFVIKCVSLCVECTFFFVLIQLLSHLEVVQVPYTASFAAIATSLTHISIRSKWLW